MGVLVLMKSRKYYLQLLLSLSALALLFVAGCGGGSKTNVVTVSVSPPSTAVIVSQSVTLTATVSGSTNVNVTWACTYTTTNVDSSGKSNVGSAQQCNSSTGNIPASSANASVTFTAPSQVPDPTKLPGTNCTSTSQNCVLTITITATSAADTKKTGKATLILDSGISVTLSPGTATVPTSSQFQFAATLTNDLQGLGVTWLITQGTPTSTVPYPALPTCSTLSPSCGSIDANGLYTAPAAVPTTATLTLVATSKADTTRFSIATITVIQGGPITFNGISPTIVPQGGTSYDVFLDAPFISSASFVTLTAKSNNGKTVINSGSGQLKVLFPIPTSTVTNPPSTGARLRLTAQNLANADTYTVSVTDPSQTVTPGGGPFVFTVIPVRPTSVASAPDSILQNNSANDLPFTIDGGYFGSVGDLAKTTFLGNSLSQNSFVPSASRQLNLVLPSSAVNANFPGLYPLAVSRTTTPLPPTDNPSVTNVAVFPDYSTTPPSVLSTNISAGTNPSAVDIDKRLGILVVAETGSNLVQFFSIGNGTLSAPLTCPVTSCAVNAPTGLSINQANHTVAVVSPQDQVVRVLPLPCPSGLTCAGPIPAPSNPAVIVIGAPNVSYPLTVSLAGLIPSNVTPLPVPYSVGVDSDTNNAIVAFSSSANPTTAKVGFLLDLNADTQPCLPGSPSGTVAPCVHAQVTLNTGQYPQIAMVPHAHLGLVTPGGTGSINGIDVTKASTSFAVTNVTLTSGLVTVTVTVPSGQSLGLNPGNPGTVLIQGVPNGKTNNTVFNGVFTVQSVLNNTSFTYALNSSVNDSSTGDASSFAFFSSPNIVIGISQTAQGIAINPITRTAAIADANATGSNGAQIDLLNSLDQSVSSIIYHSGCTAFTLNCSGAPDLLGTSSVAFQPYTNLLVGYNPQQNQVSILNPVTQGRYALACVATPGTCLPNPDQTNQVQVNLFLSQTTLPGTNLCSGVLCTVTFTPSGTTTPVTLNLFGGLAVDPATNQAFVVQSGSGTIQIVNLNPYPGTSPPVGTPYSLFKPTQIDEIQVATVSGALIGGIAGSLMPQGTLTSSSDLAHVKVFGAGFNSSTQVRLDGTAFASAGLGNFTLVSDRELDVTIPAAFLSAPHRYALDGVSVVNGTAYQSNATDFFVVLAVDMKTACSGGNPLPNSVAIADQLPGQNFAPIAVVSNSGCNNISKIDIAPQLPVYDNSGNLTGFAANPKFGTILGSIATGTSPAGVAVSPRYGLAVVANTSDGTASVLDLIAGTQKIAAVVTGTTPTGVAIDDGTGTALIANTGSNTVSELNLSLLFGSSAATTLSPSTIAVDTSPIAVAIDPDRGTNNRGLAVVTAVRLVSQSAPIGVLDSIDLGGTTPAKSVTAQVGSVTATPTGVVFNPTVSPTLFYATSSGGNVVSTFNPDTGGTTSVHVGINPTSLAINPQTGGIVTVNSSSQTISVIDTISNPFKTRSSFGLGGSSQFGVAIDQFTNLAIIADQANNRVLIFPLPN